LNALGIEEGRRRFVDEFSPFLGRESHMETAARCKVMAEEHGIPHILVVPNKVREPRDAEAMCSFFAHVGLPFTLFIPADEMILEADRLGRAPLDHDAASPAVKEIARLADALCGT
jgi:CO dehydrogenase nickel-insertion accessory protein CooC1